MRASKHFIHFFMLMACTTELVQPEPESSKEPDSYPVNFMATHQSNTSILVTWEDVTDASHYLIQAKTGDGSYVSVIDGASVADDTDWSDNNAAANVAQGAQRVMFTGLTAGTSFDFIIYPYNDGPPPYPDYKTDRTAPASSATTSEDVVVEPPAHVTDFKATVISNTSIKLSWVDATKVDKYILLAKDTAGSFAPVADGTLVADDGDWSDHNAALNVNQSVQEAIFSGLSENKSYDFIIYPYNEGGDPDPNFKIDGDIPTASSTTTKDEPIAHVTNFAVTVLSNTSLKVSWHDAADVDKYVVLAKTGTGSFSAVTDGTLIADDADWSDHNGALNVNQSAQEAIFSGLTENTSYDFTIYPYNEGGDPDPNYKLDGDIPIAGATTTTDEPLAHVTNFAATALSNTSMKVTWTDVSDVDKYVVLAKTGTGSFAQVSDGTLVTDDLDWNDNNAAINVNQSAQEVTFSGLASNTLYDFIIYPYNESGDPDPNYKTDGSIPSVSVSTLNETSTAFDQSLLSVVSINVAGTPFDITQYAYAHKVFPQVSDAFAYAPKIVMAPDNSGSYAIAWSDAQAKTINLTLLNSNDTKNGSDHKLVTNAEGLGGFALNGSSFVIGHISGTNNEKYTVQNFNSNFASTFSTDLTGTTPLGETWSKQSPLYFGSARIVVDQTAAEIGVFLSHEMLWDDGIRHQGGLLKFLDLNGNVLGGAGNKGSDAIGGSFWFISHNVDTRIAAQNGVFGVVGNGDAFPRALAGRVIENGTWTNKASIFAIDGSMGDNDTRTQLGGFLPTAGGEYILTFSSEVGRLSRDVNFMRLDAGLNVLSQAWLTNFSSGDEYAINVKTAKYGNDYVVAWEQVSALQPDVFKAMFAVVDASGEFVEAPRQLTGARFNRGDDFINFANGDVGWAIGSGNALKVFRLKLVDLGG